ncbi:baseplate J-like protein [Bacillus phage Kamfam]|nr:baseplate J-like protein [Bacillus phage OTooleKemple52]AXQ67259.1 baseplate J-like protein [Bacillus phage Kamfam]
MKFKSMTDIYARLVDNTITNTNKISDFSVGSAIRAIYEAISMEVEQFYVLTEENLSEAIQSGVYESFGFKRKQPQRAYTTMRITFHNPVQVNMPLPRGTRFTSSYPEYANVYEVIEDYYIPAGAVTAEFQVYCLIAGEIGNVPANAIDIMMTPLSNVKDVTNPNAVQTGQDEEPLDELKSRFRSYIESLSKGTVPAIEYGTRLVPEVSGVYIQEMIGKIVVYAHDKNGDLPDNVKLAIEASLNNYKAAGIALEVKPVARKAVDVEVTVTVSIKTAITKALEDRIRFSIESYLNNMQTSQNLILSDLSCIIKGVDKQLVYDIQYKKPTANIVVKGNEIIRSGNIKVNLV